MGLSYPAPIFGFADNCEFNGPALNSGGNFDECDPNYGPFMLNGNPAENADANIGARLLVCSLQQNVVWLFHTAW